MGELEAQGLVPAQRGAEDREGQAESFRHDPEEGVFPVLFPCPVFFPCFKGMGPKMPSSPAGT